MSLRLQPVQVATGSADQESQLVFHEGFLVAVLVQLSDEHEDAAGMWFLEAGFGRVDTATDQDGFTGFWSVSATVRFWTVAWMPSFAVTCTA